MKIEFRKVLLDNSPLCLEQDGVSFKGGFKKLSASLVAIELQMNGKILVDCAKCAKTIELDIDEKIELKVCDGFFEDENEELNVVECLDSIIDFDQIAKSEIEVIKSDYHYCINCK